MRLSFHREVQREVNEAVAWYEEKRIGLGDAFFNQLMDLVRRVSDHPERGSFWLSSDRIRNLSLKRFPYDLLYEVRNGEIRVLCLRHHKRHPRYGLRRN